MKKMMILGLMFGLAGLAGAVTSLQISVNGDMNPSDLEYSLSPGSQHLTLGIWILTDQQIWAYEGYFALLVLNSQGTITGGYTVFVPPLPPLESWPAGPEEMNGVWGSGSPVEPGIDPIGSGTMLFDNIFFSCISTEDAVIMLYALNEDFTLGSVMDQVVINQETISTPTVALTNSASGNWVNSGRAESFTASGAVSSDDHALQYKFTWGDGQVSDWGAATQTHVYSYNTAGTYSVTVQARCGADTSILSAMSAPLTMTREAIRYTATFYNDWKLFDRPSCWAFKRQCKGDADGVMDGTAKSGFVAVYTADLNLLTKTWQIWEPLYPGDPTRPGIISIPDGICADFNHVADVCAKSGLCIRVYTADLTILATNWNIKEPATGTTPSGPGVGVCPASNVNFYTN